MVARAVVHRLDPFEVFVRQRGIVRRRAAHTAVVAPVGSVDVGPVDDVKTEFVAKFVEPRRLRIVGADGVAALGFEVFQLREGGFTVCGGVVAGFDEFDLLVEAGDAAVGEFGLAEADLQRHVFAVSSVAAREEHDFVERRILGARFPFVGVGAVNEGAEAHRVGRAARNHDFADVEVEQFALRRVDVVTHGDGFVVVECVLGDDGQFEYAEFAGGVGDERDFEVADRAFVLGVEIAVFECLARRRGGVERIGRAAAQSQHDGVLAFADVGCQREFGGRRGVFDLGDLGVVDRERIGRADVFEVEEHHAVGPDVGNVDHLPDGHRIVRGRERFGGVGDIGFDACAVAGVGVVALVVGNDLGAVDASRFDRTRENLGRGRLLDIVEVLCPDACGAEDRRRQQYGTFHRACSYIG